MAYPLNIAILAYEFPALSETFVLAHATGLADLGHNVTILADRTRDEAFAHRWGDSCRLLNRTIYRTSPGNKVGRAIEAAFRAGGRAVRHPISAYHALGAIRYRTTIGAIYLLDWWTRFEGLPKFDIVHAHFGPMGRIAAALRDIRAIDGKIVTSFHGVDMSRNLMSDPDLYCDLFRRGDAFLPVSEHWRNRLIEHDCPAERIHVHHMGIDIDRFSFHARQTSGRGKGNQPLRVITVGRLVEKKGIAYGLEAVPLLAHRGHRILYTIIGDGPLRTHLERLAGVLGIAENVRFLGARDHRNVRQLIYQSDVMLAPSTTDGDGDQEGIPVTLMEAMATGLPVVSTLHSGIPELIEHGASGLLADGLARRLAHAARATVEREFNQARLVSELADYYEILLEMPAFGAADAARFTPQPVGHPHPTEAFRS